MEQCEKRRKYNETRREQRRKFEESDPEGYQQWVKAQNIKKGEWYKKARAKNPEKFRADDRRDAARRYADPERREKIKQRNNKAAKEKKQWFQELKSTMSCQECGNAHPAILMFHHLDPAEKDAPVSTMVVHQNRCQEIVMAEIKKCAALCSNCHAVFHYLYGVIDFPKYQKGMIMKDGKYRNRSDGARLL